MFLTSGLFLNELVINWTIINILQYYGLKLLVSDDTHTPTQVNIQGVHKVMHKFISDEMDN